MVYFAEMTDDERFARLERKATEIRKMLFGALVIAKDSWRGDLLRTAEGLEIIEETENAEESYTDGMQPDKFKKLERAFDVIDQRAKSLFDLISYISKYKKCD